MFGAEPARLERDYAKWMLTDPPVFNEHEAATAEAGAPACCTPSMSSGKPVGITVKPASSRC